MWCHRYGFIIMDGNGSLFGALSGNTREILHKFQVWWQLEWWQW